MLAQLGTSRQDTSMFACCINGVALVCFGTHAAGLDTTYVTAGGRAVSITRIIMWLHTTPCMLCMLFAMTNLERRHLVAYLAADITMLLGAFPVMFARSVAVRAAATLVSTATFAYVIAAIYGMMSQAIRETSRFLRNSTAGLLVTLEWTSLVLWSAFPVIHYVGAAGMLTELQEYRLWLAVDCTTKIIYNGALLYCSVMSARKRAAISAHIARMGERDKMISDLEALLENRNLMISLVSHEVRTPLNGIIGLASTLVAHSALEPADRQTAQLIKSSGLRLLNLINDVLDSFTLEYSNLVVSPVKMNLQTEVLDCVNTVLPLVKRGVVAYSSISRHTPPVYADPMRFAQIMLNLLGNAIRFTQRGSITVSAEVAPGSQFAVVSVADTGVGIKQENLQKIFDTWCTGDEQTTRKYGGTGLGLSLVRQLVESHGGQVWVTSRLAEGSTFCFTLPLYDPAAHAPAEDERGGRDAESAKASISSQGAPLQSEREADARQQQEERQPLVVCGEGDVALAAQLAALEPYDVRVCHSGVELTRLLAELKQAPECIILDFDLPCGDIACVELCTRIKRDLPACPIIMTNSSSEQQHIVQALQAGAADFVAKPYEVGELQHRLRVVVQARDAPLAGRRLSQPEGDGALPAAAAAATRSALAGDMESRLQHGESFECASATALILSVHHVGSLVEALGLERVTVLVRTLYSQCAALSRSERVLLFGGLSSSIVLVGDPDSQSAELDVLLCGKKLLQWAETINESLSHAGAVSISAAVATGALRFELDALAAASTSVDRVQLAGPVMRELRRLARASLPGCLCASAAVQRTADAALGLLRFRRSAGPAGHVLYHLDSWQQPLEAPEDAADPEAVSLDLARQSPSEDQLALLALTLAAPMTVLQRVVTQTRLSFSLDDIKRDLSAAKEPACCEPDTVAITAQLQATTEQCVRLYRCIFALLHVARGEGALRDLRLPQPPLPLPGAAASDLRARGTSSGSGSRRRTSSCISEHDARRAGSAAVGGTGTDDDAQSRGDGGLPVARDVRTAVEMLEATGLQHMSAAFVAEDITVDVLPHLSREQLMQLGARSHAEAEAFMLHARKQL